MIKSPHMLAAALLAMPLVSFAVIIGPYTTDANTLHLWQFNEAAGSTTTAANGSAATPRSLTAEGIGSGAGDATTTQSGAVTAAGLTGFGNAANTNGGSDDGFRTLVKVAPTEVTGANGAFTFEAIIKTSAIGSEQSIITMDGAGTPRSFLFRITSTGLNFSSLSTSSQSYTATIPASGVDAFDANAWFHVAVTYNGSQNTADNLKLFWTKMDESRETANEIGSFNLSADLPLTNSGNILNFIGIGNEYRPAASLNLDGLIDEVRISSIARSADQMMFAIPEPGTLALVGVALVTALALRRRKG
jgi:hypothetical protein